MDVVAPRASLYRPHFYFVFIVPRVDDLRAQARSSSQARGHLGVRSLGRRCPVAALLLHVPLDANRRDLGCETVKEAQGTGEIKVRGLGKRQHVVDKLIVDVREDVHQQSRAPFAERE